MACTTSVWSATMRRRFMIGCPSLGGLDGGERDALRRPRHGTAAAGDPAEVDEVVALGGWDVVHARVGGDDDQHVRELGEVLQRGAAQVELRQLRHELVVVGDLGAELSE